MARLELDVVQTSTGTGVKDTARQLEDLYQAERKVKKAQDDEAAALRKVELAQLRLNEVRKTAEGGSARLLAAEDKLATAQGKANTAAGKTGTAVGNLSKLHQNAADSANKHATAVGQVDEKSTKAGGGLKSMAKGVGGLAGALGVAGLVDKVGGAIADFGLGTITAASDLQQASGAAQAVFGKDYPAIEAAANKAATAVGLSSAEYQQMSAVMGAGLKNKGLTDYADKTQQVIGLGADLAAQFGGSTQDAVEAIGALMRGEADPIEKYGVGINEAAVNAELLAKGQSKLTGSALVQAQAQARLKLLYDQTGTAQGTFAKESNTLAGSQQRVGAQVQDLQAKLGTALLPALSGVTDYLGRTMAGGTGLSKVLGVVGTVITSYVTPIITQVQQGFANFKASIDKVTGGSDQTQQMLTKVGEVVGQVAGFVGRFVGGQLSLFLTGLGNVVEITKAVVDWVGRMADKVGSITLPFGLGQIRDVFADISTKVQDAIGWIGRMSDKVGGFLATGNANALSSVLGLFRADGYSFGGGATTTGSSMIPLLVPAPTITNVINVDGASLRGIIRAEIRATLRPGGTLR